MLFASNLPEWGRYSLVLVSKLQAVFGLNLSVENDANLATLGERSCGWAGGKRQYLRVSHLKDRRRHGDCHQQYALPRSARGGR